MKKILDKCRCPQCRSEELRPTGNQVARNFGKVVSFGGFHHTFDPAACVRELARVLARNGRTFVYLYKNHEDNPWKRAGVGGTVLMKTSPACPHRCGGRFAGFSPFPASCFFLGRPNC